MYNYLFVREREHLVNQFAPSGKDIILMIRGLSRSYRTWMGLHEDLSESFDVLCFDLPGVGLSKNEKPLYSVKKMAQKVLERVNTLEIKQLYLVAPSLGALVICEMALHLPREKLGGLVLMSPSHSGIGLNRISRQALKNLYQALRASVESRTEMAKELLVGKQADGQHPFERYPERESQWVQQMIQDSEELGAKGQLAQIIAALSHTSKTSLNAIRHYQIPVKFLIPTHDKLIPPKHSHEMYRYLRHPHSAVIEMQYAGHDLLVSHKAQLQDIITQFIRHQDSHRVYPIQPIPPKNPPSRRQISFGILTMGLFLLSLIVFRRSSKP